MDAKFDTCGGAVVTWTPTRGHNGNWACGGCQLTGQLAYREAAEMHASMCRAKPGK